MKPVDRWWYVCIQCERLRTTTGRCSGCALLVGDCNCAPLQMSIQKWLDNLEAGK